MVCFIWKKITEIIWIGIYFFFSIKNQLKSNQTIIIIIIIILLLSKHTKKEWVFCFSFSVYEISKPFSKQIVFLILNSRVLATFFLLLLILFKYIYSVSYTWIAYFIDSQKIFPIRKKQWLIESQQELIP